MRCIRLENLKPLTWKNGGGTTKEIAIAPAGADFVTDAFLWRLSSADVRASGPFSKFEGYERLLSVWQGEGLIVNGSKLLPSSVFKFSGHTEVSCELISGPVVDIGVIFHPKWIDAEMKPISFMNPVTQFNVGAGTHFLMCTSGSISVNGIDLKAGDVAEFASPTYVEVRYEHSQRRDEAVSAMLISLSLKSHI